MVLITSPIAPSFITKIFISHIGKYNQFKAFQDKTIFSFASTTGETGGVLYYELGPNRPDLVLKDMVSILHPELLKDYTPTFFKPLN